MSAGNRVCPQCGNATAGLMCPIDGWATVPAAIVSDARLKPGSVLLSAFRVGAFLEDDGAMAIYGGSRIDNGRPVRISTIILPPSASLPEIARMQRSAHKLEEVRHPNIAQVFASGTTDRGDLAIVSEHIEGPTLAELLRGGELGAERALSLGIGLFQALEAAHAAGIAHHDLSPERIRMAPGRVVVCDFGLADILRTPKSGAPWGSGEGEVPLLSRGLPYRAPEQARDRAVTKQADVYAVGAILYEALSGRPLFVEKSSADYLIAHMMKTPVTPPVRNDLVFDGLVELVMKCLEKKPWHRPENATFARETLEDLRNRAVEVMAQTAGRPVPQSRRTARPVVVEVVEVSPGPPPIGVRDVRAAEARAKAAMAIAETASAIAESAGSLVESANQAVEAAMAKESGAAEARNATLMPGAKPSGPSGLLSIAEIAHSMREGVAPVPVKAETTIPALPQIGVVPLATRGTGRPAALTTDDNSKPLQTVQKPRRSRWGLALVAGVIVGLGAVALGYALSGGPRSLHVDAQVDPRLAQVERVEVEATEVAKPVEVEVAKPVEVAAEVAKPVEVAAEVAKPVEVAAEVAKPVAVAAEVAKPVAVAAEVAKPVEIAAEVAKPVEAVKLAEAAKPVEAVKLAEAAKPVEVAKPVVAASVRPADGMGATRDVTAKVEVAPTEDKARRDEALRIASEEAEARRAARAAETAKRAEERRPKKPGVEAEAQPEQKHADEPLVRRALLSSVPTGAAVLVDGKSVGRTPMTLSWTPGKTVSVWVTLSGYEPANFQVGESQNGKMMRLELIPLGGTAHE